MWEWAFCSVSVLLLLHTCILLTLSASSSLCLSLSACLTCSSCTCVSAFFLRCSDSPLPCMSVCSSICSSFLSDSRACFVFSTDTLFCPQRPARESEWGHRSARVWLISGVCECVSYPFDLLQLLVELVEGLTVFLPHLSHKLLVNLSLVLQSLLQMSHFSLTLRPAPNTHTQTQAWGTSAIFNQTLMTIYIFVFKGVQNFTRNNWEYKMVFALTIKMDITFQSLLLNQLYWIIILFEELQCNWTVK